MNAAQWRKRQRTERRSTVESVPREMPLWEHEYLSTGEAEKESEQRGYFGSAMESSRPITPADVADEAITEGRSRPLKPNPHDD